MRGRHHNRVRFSTYSDISYIVHIQFKVDGLRCLVLSFLTYFRLQDWIFDPGGVGSFKFESAEFSEHLPIVGRNATLTYCT